MPNIFEPFSFKNPLTALIKEIDIAISNGKKPKNKETLRAALNKAKTSLAINQKETKGNQVISLPYSDYKELLEDCCEALERFTQGKVTELDSKPLRAAKHALKLDSHLVKRELGEDTLKSLKERHIETSKAVFSSHNLVFTDNTPFNVVQLYQDIQADGLSFKTKICVTAILLPEGAACVYFSDRFAYFIKKPSLKFYHDLFGEKNLLPKKENNVYNS